MKRKGLLLLFFIRAILNAQAPSSNGGALYVATDKTIYTPGEAIWFSGYFLPQEPLPDTLQPDIMAVALIRQDTTGFLLSQNYLMQQGCCPGTLTLPQELQPGNYELVAALNLLDPSGKPRFSFRKRLTIKTTEQPPFHLSFHIEDSLHISDTIRISMQATAAEGVLINDKKAAITYHRPGQKPNTQKLDITGRATLIIPLRQPDTSLPVLYTVTTANGQSKPFTLWLPLKKTIHGSAAPTGPQKTIPTHQPANLLLAHTINNDSLEATITTTQPQKVVLAYRNLLSTEQERSDPIYITGHKKISLPLGSFKKGTYILSLFNETGTLLDQKPFFAHYNNRSTITLQTTKDRFQTREKITVKINAGNEQGQPLKAILTAWCVNTTRLENHNRLLLPAYYYTQPLNDPYQSATIYSSSSLLSNTLEQAADAGTPANTVAPPLHKPTVSGSIVMARGGVEVEKQLMVLLLRDTLKNFITTDSSGRFFPAPTQLVTPEGSVFTAAAGNINKRAMEGIGLIRYAVIMTNPMQEPMNYLQQPGLPAARPYQEALTGNYLVFKDSFEAKTMRMVTVRATKPLARPDALFGNNCGDFVCINNILNCPAHIGDEGNTLPVKGKIYRSAGGNIIYQGCADNNIERVNTARLFTGMEEKDIKEQESLHYLSTLCWRPFLPVPGSATLDFYSSDLPGNYKIIVEGIAENGDLLHQEKEIIIEANK
ncbi:hypothetical protein [Niabella drilacis]|uniref:MG2 domain-containing protein n=1 Tax=Niabella drilacis (strain DSM 25811 / CCM 8410 / CCUG 62505 / LMG 26954 / E90) TaxID=1285928 RepID=A0A1G7B1E9_NIADE|nr:hypothetical protein [Niabella drilacis]SDE20086.1 hypothetical protein SAMN04487894_1269 [Niabella drilacis]